LPTPLDVDEAVWRRRNRSMEETEVQAARVCSEAVVVLCFVTEGSFKLDDHPIELLFKIIFYI
jgi:hypothetical protein